ncbi:VOC family protein [Streptomyces sp. WG7]|uniref:VOC family protein n=1 Tax=Streptomyces sp. WG7 TaxID=3417650 RepID=UPI003CF148CE
MPDPSPTPVPGQCVVCRTTRDGDRSSVRATGRCRTAGGEDVPTPSRDAPPFRDRLRPARNLGRRGHRNTGNRREDASEGLGGIRVGDTVVPAFDRRPDWPAMPSLLRIYVPDADEAMASAVQHGAEVITEVADSAWGDRGGRIRDPFGNIWWVVSRVEQVTPDLAWQRLAEPE